MTTERKTSRGQLPSQTESDDVFFSSKEEAGKASGVQQKLFAAIDDGDLIKVDDILKEISANTSTLDIRDEHGLNTYSHAISEGFAPIIITLLRYDIPLGDALLRACASSFEEAAKIILKHAKKLPDEEKRVIIECRCDNDDFQGTMSPLKMAAIRNNFVIVQLLLKARAERIQEPNLEGLAEATLSEVVEYLDIYRALSSPAYLGLAHSNALSNAFKLTGRLRKIAGTWEAVNKKFYGLADQVEQFAASLLDFVANSYELGTLFRQSDNPEVVHSVSQVQTAVDYDQKAFVAHPYTQTIMSITFYRSLDVQSTMFNILSLLSIFGYPFICLAYLLVQHERLKAFLSIPHIKLCMFFGSDFAFLACTAAVSFLNGNRGIDIVTVFVVVFGVALCWKHICDIIEYGIGDFLGYGMNTLELIIVIISFVLAMCKWMDILGDDYVRRAKHRHNERVAMVTNTTVILELSNTTEFEELERFVSADWNDPQIILNVMFALVILFNVLRAFNTVLNSFHDLYAIWESTVGAVQDIITFLIVFAIFLLAFAVGLRNLYVPQARVDESECGDMMECGLAEEGYRNIPVAMLTLWWAFNGLGDPAARDDKLTMVNVLHIATVGVYLIVALVMVNTLVAMLGSRFSAVEENSDTEWKFGRSKMWLRFIRSDIVIPPPFNLLPTSGYLLQLFKNCFSFCTGGCTKTEQRQPDKPEEKTTPDGNPRKVLKEVLKRYTTTKIEKTDEDDSIGIDDLRQLKQDFVTVKFNIQTKLKITKEIIDAIWVTIRSIEFKIPIMDTINTTIPVTRTEIADMFKINFPVVDDDMGHIQGVILDVEEALLYRPEVAPKPSPRTAPEEPSPRTAPEEPVLVKEETSPPEMSEPAPTPEKLYTLWRGNSASSLTRKMATMFDAGRTVDVDQEVTDEIHKYRQSYSAE